MTNSYIALDRVSVALPDGAALFSNLTDTIDQRRTGLVGRNGVGKSMLARILTGELAPTSGRCDRYATVHYLAQDVGRGASPWQTVAALAGVQERIDALVRVGAGQASAEDFELLGGNWDIAERFADALESAGLGHLAPYTRTSTLSGGETMRVALIGAMLSGADLLILDEPTNHLDQPSRQALTAQLQCWQRGLLVISHDRALLDTMERTLELTPHGLRSYGGAYSFYRQAKEQEECSLIEEVDRRKLALKREKRNMHEERMRLDQRSARGREQAKVANQAKILIGRQKERNEQTSGKQRLQLEHSVHAHDEALRRAAAQVDRQAAIKMYAGAHRLATHGKAAELADLALPYVQGRNAVLSLCVTGRQRIGVTGPNGAGKSTLLKVIAGQLAPLSGKVDVPVRCAYLDQALQALAADRSILDQLAEVNRTAGEATLRTWLAHIGLDARRSRLPARMLSGGERLKAALAQAMYADEPAQLLLLDEPGNHLDLASVCALEAMLLQYEGALMVVSHDSVFLDRLGLTHRLTTGPAGWQCDPI